MSDEIEELVRLILGYGWLGVLAAWGGTVNYLSRVKRCKINFSCIELLGEWVISAFAGVMTAFLLEGILPPAGVMAAAGIAGHMGGRAIYILEKRVERLLSK